MRSGVHGGVKVMYGFTCSTPSSSPTNSFIWSLTWGPIGHPGEVSVNSMFTSPPSTSIPYTRPSSTKSSPSSGSMTLASASSTSSTDGMGAMLVASARASAGAYRHLRRRPARGAVRHLPGGRRDRHPPHARDPRGRLAARLVAAEVAGGGGLAALQRDDAGRADPAPRGGRRRARDLRRRVPDHSRLHHRHRRGAAPAAAHARAVPRPRGAPRRDAGGVRGGRPRARAPRPGRRGRRLRRGHSARPRRAQLRAAAAHVRAERALRRPGSEAAANVSEPALSLAFFDPDRSLSGTARAGATLIFEGQRVRTLSQPPDIGRD